MGRESIAIVSAQFLPHIGGVERYTDCVAKEIQRRGYDVTVVTSEYPECSNREMVDGVEVYRLPSYRLMDGRYPILKPSQEKRHLQEVLADKHLYHMLANTRFYPISLWAVRWAYKNHVPCTVVEHGTAHLQMGKLSFVAEWVEHVFTTILKRYHPTFMGVSRAACEWSKHFGLDNSEVAHNAIAVEEFQNKKFVEKGDMREKYQIPTDAYFLVYAGRLIPEKGLIQLAKAVEEVSKEHKIHLLLAGDGPLYEELSRNYGKTVQCIGSVSREEILQLLHACDSFCLPSDSEGLPTVVLEAAMCQAHVIATQYGGTGEIISDDDFGVCLKDNRVETVEKGIREALLDEEKRKQQAKNLHERVKEEYSWCKTVDALLCHFNNETR